MEDEPLSLINTAPFDPKMWHAGLTRSLCRMMRYWCDPSTGDVNVARLTRVVNAMSGQN